MSLQTLKVECRKRGLKVSGRKAELASRIAGYESSFSTRDSANMSTFQRPKTAPLRQMKSMQFSQSAWTPAKGDDSHIDFIKPVDLQPEPLVKDDYIIQIPSISTEASKRAVTKLEKKLAESKRTDPNETVVSKAPLSDSRIFGTSSIEPLETQNELAYKAELPEAKQFVEKPYHYEHRDIPKSDKGFFAAFAGLTALWWALGPKGKKENK